jgi:hypothetical protein
LMRARGLGISVGRMSPPRIINLTSSCHRVK